MKLALVRQAYTPFGGAERFANLALETLSRAGVSVTIVARNWTDSATTPLIVCNPFYLGRTWRDASFSRAVRTLINARTFDLVQSHERIPGCDIFRAGDGVHATWLDIRASTGSQLFRFGQAISPWHRYTVRAERRMFEHPNLKAVICNSRMVKDDIAARFNLPDSKLHVIYNGVDTGVFHPGLRDQHRGEMRRQLSAGENTPVALHVGSGYARKGVAQLLAALAQANSPDLNLWIVGKERHENRFRQLASALGVAERVRFLGPQRDVRPFYGAADFFAMCTSYDPFPNAAAEALACGLPVLTTTTSGAKELIRPTENGMVCDFSDIAQIASALDSLARTAGQAHMRMAAVESVAVLSLEEMNLKLQNLYASILRNATR